MRKGDVANDRKGYHMEYATDMHHDAEVDGHQQSGRPSKGPERGKAQLVAAILEDCTVQEIYAEGQLTSKRSIKFSLTQLTIIHASFQESSTSSRFSSRSSLVAVMNREGGRLT